MISELIFIFLLIVANGVFAMAETALVSARKVRLQQRANAGDANARLALALANEPGDFLSLVQIGITLIGTLAGAFGGATLAEELAAWLSRTFPRLADYSGTISMAVVVLGITYLSLVVGELAPKRLALSSPERIAMFVAGPMRWLSRLFSPLVRVLSASTQAVLYVLRAPNSPDPPVTEEEIKLLIEQGRRAGVFEEAEQAMVAGVFRLGNRQVGTNMTPRTEIVWLDIDDPPQETHRKIINSTFSRFPVCRGNLDTVLGIVRAKDLLNCNLADQPFDLKAMLRPSLFVPESMPALRAMELFKSSRTHVALVVGEFGEIQGMVTINDLLETVVGDRALLGERTNPEVTQREDGSWLLGGMLPMDEFRELFQVSEQPGEDKATYQTLGGFVMAYLGRIPATADHFEWAGLSLEVVDMDGHRVDKVLVKAK